MWETQQTVRVNVSMFSVKWGDVLSMLLPGVIALVAVAPYSPLLESWLNNLDKYGLAGGVGLLIVAVIAGGVLGAFTRLTWEKFVLVKLCPPKDILSNLNENNAALYEQGVENSYKYVTFYSNLAWAMLLLVISRFLRGLGACSGVTLFLIAIGVLLLAASYVQWTYYVNWQTKVFEKKEAK
jgi:hypothetical protein